MPDVCLEPPTEDVDDPQLPVTIEEQAGECTCPGCVRPGGHLGPCADQQGVAIRRGDEVITPEDIEEQEQDLTDQETETKRPGEDVPLINEELFAKRPRLDANVVDLVGEEPVLKLHIDINSAEEVKEFNENCDAFICKKLRNTEVVYEKLDEREKLLFDEAMAKEVNNFLRYYAVRACLNNTEVQKAYGSNRITRCRWVLDKRDIPEEEREAAKPKPGEPTAVSDDGTWKAKARITILGFEHPDLGSDMYKTAAPVANQITKSLLKLKAVTDGWLMEKADATSAFLQTTKSLEERELWTWGVPELSKALGAKPGEPLRVVGNTYGYTTAPRDFWQDVGRKTEENGGIPIMGDPCTWIFVKEETINDKYPKVCGVSLNQADDFLIMGDHKDKEWMAYREKLKAMCEWGTWQVQQFRFTGADETQFANFEIETSDNAVARNLEEEGPACDRCGAQPSFYCRMCQTRGCRACGSICRRPPPLYGGCLEYYHHAPCFYEHLPCFFI